MPAMKFTAGVLATAAVASVQASASASASVSEAAVAANPIRKVVTMLQAIQGKVEAEAKKETEMHKKYMCYCKTAGGTLEASIAAAGDKAPEVESAIKEAEAQHAQLGEDLTAHQSDRATAKKTMEEATAIREKEAAAFAAYKAEADANIAALGKAAAAVDAGMAGAFLQSAAAESLRKLIQAKDDLSEGDRQEVVAFLSASSGSDYSPASGEIAGILKQIKDQMSKDLADATATEKTAVANYDSLMSSKTKEVNALTASIEEKTVRTGELAVHIAQQKNELTDTQAQLLEDKKFLADLDGNCKTRESEWDEIVKTRNEELVAIAETIKLLQDDDALELFKKTLPGASSFVQMKSSSETARSRVLAMVEGMKKTSTDRPKLDFISLALKGKKIGFEKVIGMIDEMVVTLKKEQTDDDDKKEYCTVSFDAAEDKAKGLDRSISDSEAAIEDAKEAISTLSGEIKTLTATIKDLDKSVAEAAEQRKSENEDFTELMAQNNAAKELLGVAKNRLAKFYNPKLYVPPPKRELSEEDRIAVNMGGTAPPTPAPGGIAGTGVTVLVEVQAHVQREAPAPPPEAVGAYKKKGEEAGGVVAMMDLLIKDLDKQMTEAETAEKDAQADYVQMTTDSADKRAQDAKSLADKTSAKADAEADLQKHGDDKTSSGKELVATHQYIASLHSECDWLIQYFDMRKEARDSEIDSLGKAKAVLSGADFSLVQLGAKNLRGSA